MRKKSNQISLPKNIVKKANDTYLTLLALIDFLKTKDKKFEEFVTISSISLNIPINDFERTNILLTLNDCKKLSLENLPNISQFRQMLINKGVNPKKFNIELITNLLKSYLWMPNRNLKDFIACQILKTSNNKD